MTQLHTSNHICILGGMTDYCASCNIALTTSGAHPHNDACFYGRREYPLQTEVNK